MQIYYNDTTIIDSQKIPVSVSNLALVSPMYTLILLSPMRRSHTDDLILHLISRFNFLQGYFQFQYYNFSFIPYIAPLFLHHYLYFIGFIPSLHPYTSPSLPPQLIISIYSISYSTLFLYPYLRPSPYPAPLPPSVNSEPEGYRPISIRRPLLHPLSIPLSPPLSIPSVNSEPEGDRPLSIRRPLLHPLYIPLSASLSIPSPSATLS